MMDMKTYMNQMCLNETYFNEMHFHEACFFSTKVVADKGVRYVR